ncbi:MAG: sigma-54-dependent Fis family transcriptional regulator [Planctomycetes bacterium]|nr:sigma-54-dependent Fis family transcriptional regulator [Planctomycetota bacterium]
MLLRTLASLPAALTRRVEHLLAAAPVRFVPAAGPVAAAIDRGQVDLVLVHVHRFGPALERALRRQRDGGQAPDVIVFVDEEEPRQRAQLLGNGALAVLNGTLDDASLAEVLAALVQRARGAAMQRLRALRSEPPASLADFVSKSDEMLRLLAVARRMVDSDANLLLTGETGVGKERLARAIHGEGPRRDGPFVAINCGALPEPLLESELFGHEQGAFTGAVRAHRGLFELAHGGTLFLDEVGEMPPSLQVKLLRVLQDRRIRPVGGERDVAVDVRVMAATNRDLLAEMQAGRFRADLFYRLAVVALLLPPLRERRADIPVLVQNHLEAWCVRLNRRPITVAADALAALCAHEWPGNVRELANVLERAALLGDGQEITARDLAGIAPASRQQRATDGALLALPFAAAEARWRDAFEREYFTALLRECRGRVGLAAQRAGISVRTLYGKLQRLGLDKLRFRGDGGAAEVRGGDAACFAAGERAP